MEQMLLISGSDGFSGPWDGTIPPADVNTLFRMFSFATTADIRDKGPNAIGVTNSNVTVGSNSYGTYMQFNGTNSSLAFTSALLNGNSFDVTFILSDVTFPSTALYDVVLLDGRPNITNGRYLTVGYSRAQPFKSSISFNGVGVFGTEAVPSDQFPIVFKISVRPGVFRVTVNGKQIQELAIADNVLTGSAPWRVGRNAFAQQAATPWLNGKIYYLDFKKV